MVKKKVEEPKVEEEDLVEVSMTEEEKEQFVAFKLQKEKDEAKLAADSEIAHGELRFEHHINGIKFGPGKFQAPKATAVDLIRADGRYLLRRMKEKESESYMIDIMSRGPGRITKIEQKIL